MMERLDLAALFFKSAALADAATGKLATRLRGVTGVYGYLVRVHADGWARFCAAERLDSAACEAAPGAFTLEQAAREAGVVGYTDAQAAEFVRWCEPDAPGTLKTAGSVAAGRGGSFRFLLAQWE